MNVQIQCEICTHIVGTVDPDKLGITIKASDFGPPDGGWPDPFDASCDYVWLKCPMCGKHPFGGVRKGKLMLADSQWLTRIDGKWLLPVKAVAPVPIEETEEYAKAWGVDLTGREVTPERVATEIKEGLFTPQPQENEVGETGLSLMEDGPTDEVDLAEPKPPINPEAGMSVEDKVFKLLASGMKPIKIVPILVEVGHKITIEQIEQKIDEKIVEWSVFDKPGVIGKRIGMTAMQVGKRLKYLNQSKEVQS